MNIILEINPLSGVLRLNPPHSSEFFRIIGCWKCAGDGTGQSEYLFYMVGKVGKKNTSQLFFDVLQLLVASKCLRRVG